jgi:butyryl-CoA dehydrogenase
MEYLLMNKDQKDLVAMVHALLEQELDSRVAELDRIGEFPMDVAEKLGKMGFYGMTLPEKYGGAGLDPQTMVHISEAMAYHDAGFATSFSAQTFGTNAMMIAGTDEQINEFAPRAANGEFWSMCITEPQSGSDAGNVKTKARKDGDDYIISGNKCFVTNGGISNLFTVLARTGEDTKGHNGLSLFIVEKNMPGVMVGKEEDKMGMRLSNTTDLALDEVRVPKRNMIGKEGTGFSTVMKMLSRTRPTGMASAVGVGQKALDLAVDYCRTREAFGTKIGKFEGLQFKLADMEMKLQCCRSQLQYAAELVSQGNYNTLVGSATKLFVSEAVLDITLQAQQIYGGYGYSKEYPLEKLVRDARLFSIFEGSSEIQRFIIGNTLVGKLK